MIGRSRTRPPKNAHEIPKVVFFRQPRLLFPRRERYEMADEPPSQFRRKKQNNRIFVERLRHGGTIVTNLP
jgi:hypothetical protein